MAHATRQSHRIPGYPEQLRFPAILLHGNTISIMMTLMKNRLPFNSIRVSLRNSTGMKSNMRKTLIGKINNSEWWHVPPQDPDAYGKQGKFLASTYLQASFYGRPNDTPERVTIQNPVYGFSEEEIIKKLFPTQQATRLIETIRRPNDKNWYQIRTDADARFSQRAKVLGYDAIVLMVSTGRNEIKRNRKPRSIELNLLHPVGHQTIQASQS
ncbi:MAG: hypothetical protein V1809_14720 [Planctomycetota bacterium]